MKTISNWVKNEDHNYVKLLLNEWGGISVYYSNFTLKFHIYSFGKLIALDKSLAALGGFVDPEEAKSSADRIFRLNIFI